MSSVYLRIARYFVGWLGLCMLLMWGCGPGQECATNGDCTSNPDFGSGYTCQAVDGENKCQKACPSSCSANGDCGKCTGGKNFCVSGKCTFEPTQCPATCSADSECGNCDSGKNFCLGGVCSIKQAVCPNSCAQDSDCIDCAGGNNYCLSGTCSTQLKCESSCTTNDDCLGCPDSKTSCVEGKCDKKLIGQKCPVSCAQDGDCTGCPDNRTKCTNSICVPPPACPSSCTRDGDCAKCASGLTSCVNGKCDKKQDPTCKDACTTDGDCSTCPNGRSKCDAGVCRQPPQCPNSCIGDNDCLPCATDKRTCVNGKCDKKPVCPSSCSKDTECAPCGPDQQQCINGKCDKAATCPSTCSQNSDCGPCGANQQVCTSGKCGPPPACPSSCSVKSDCAKCKDGKVACVSGKCAKPTSCPGSCGQDAECVACGGNFECTATKCQPKKPPLTGPGQECSASNRCISGDLCITLEGSKSYCFQDCSSDASLCAKNTVDGRTQCVAFAQDTSGNTISVCLNRAKKGEACGFGVQNQAQCETGRTPPLYCNSKNLCAEAVVQTTAGAACNKSTDTSEPRKVCDSAKNLACSETTGKCATVSSAKEGEECDPTGANLGKIVRCDPAVSGLTCVRFDSAGTINRCHLSCTPTGSNQCKHKTGLTCAPLLSNGRGLCMDTTCSSNSDCVFTGYECGNSSSTTSMKLCVPPLPTGPKKYTEICGTPARTKGCGSGLFCLSEQNKSEGFCSIDCTQAGTTCPRSGTLSATCANINSTTKACVFQCSAANRRCPTGLTCNTNFGLCLAP